MLIQEALIVGALLVPLYSVVRDLSSELDIENERTKELLAVFTSGALFHLLAEATGVNEYYLHHSYAYNTFVAREDKLKNGYRLRRSPDDRVCPHAVWACSQRN
jgi:hypothetical protein